MPVNPRLLDLWERELKLQARMEEVESVKKEIAPLLVGRDNGPTTMFRVRMQEREQALLRELHSVVAHRERLEDEEDNDN